MEKEDSNRSDHKKEFVDKVAEKLGVPPERVAAAL